MNMMFRCRLCASIFRCCLLLAANSPKLYETTVTGFIWQRLISQAPVVRKAYSAIHWINYYPLDSAIGFPNTYPMDSDLSDG